MDNTRLAVARSGQPPKRYMRDANICRAHDIRELAKIVVPAKSALERPVRPKADQYGKRLFSLLQWLICLTATINSMAVRTSSKASQRRAIFVSNYFPNFGCFAVATLPGLALLSQRCSAHVARLALAMSALPPPAKAVSAQRSEQQRLQFLADLSYGRQIVQERQLAGIEAPWQIVVTQLLFAGSGADDRPPRRPVRPRPRSSGRPVVTRLPPAGEGGAKGGGAQCACADDPVGGCKHSEYSLLANG
jgi:hypothetical protein